MIRSSQTSFRLQDGRPEDSRAPTPYSPPPWLRQAVDDAQSLAKYEVADMAEIAGAAFCALDAVIRRRECWAGAWRQRLALAAAAATVKRIGRREDEAALRDALLLTRPGDDVGPSGHILLVWRQLAARPPTELLTEEGLAGLVAIFGKGEGETARESAAGLHRLARHSGAMEQLSGAFCIAERSGLESSVGSRASNWAGNWFADALLAQRLNWPYSLPLLGTGRVPGGEVVRRGHSLHQKEPAADADAALTKELLAGQARAALRAIDLFTEMGRRADRLLAVLPKLRARSAGRVVEQLLSDDAITASQAIAGMSDRGLRRLFERLVDLGAVRELSGRAIFRIYGL